MQKPSKKVFSIMIVVGAIVIAFIGADKIKNKDFSKNNEVAGEIESANPGKSMSIGDYMTSKIESNEENGEQEAPKTVTEFALTELFGNYQNLKQSSNNTPENIDSLTTSLANQTKQYSTIQNKYVLLDLETFPDYQKEETKQYGNSFAKTLEVYFKQSALIDNNEESLAYVKKYSEIQKEYAEALSEIRIPRSISDEHLIFTNNIYKISVALPHLATIEDDPLLYILILEQYKKYLDENVEILKKISTYFELNDIIFSDNEPGAMWNNF